MSAINHERLLEHFFEYVRIDSETGYEKAMAERVTADLRALGCEVTTDNAGETMNSTGFNVYATLKGDPSKPSMLMSAHLDTVVPGAGVEPYVAEDGFIRSRGDTILGGDDKSGVAAIIEALRVVREAGLAHRTVEVVFTIREESGLRGAKALDFSRIQSKQAVVLDSSGDVGKIITVAPGQIKISAEVIGRAAHAGVAPEKGVSAIHVAAKGVAQMNLLRIDEETTCNIGTFTAQGATNIVPERVKIEAEVRSRNLDKLNAQAKHMVDCLQTACDQNKGRLDCKVETSYIGYAIADGHPLVKEVAAACGALGIVPSLAATGGGSDANIMNRNGIAAVVLGTGMDKVHTTDEQLSLQNLHNIAALCLQLMLA